MYILLLKIDVYASGRFRPFSAVHASIACCRCENIMVCPDTPWRPKSDVLASALKKRNYLEKLAFSRRW